MMVNESNKKEWVIKKVFMRNFFENNLFLPEQSVPVGAEIENIYTGDIYRLSFKTIKEMEKLGVIYMDSQYTAEKVYPPVFPEDMFDNLENDMAFLEKYVRKDENKKQKRPTWDEYFMSIARATAKRSTCDRLHVGAVLVTDDKRIIATGYNGSISGHEHCDDIGHLMYERGCKRTIHAEMNVILMCARHGIPTKDTILYVTHYPCPDCMKHINQAGIKEVVYEEFYQHRYENNFHIGLNIRQLKLDESQ